MTPWPIVLGVALRVALSAAVAAVVAVLVYLGVEQQCADQILDVLRRYGL